MVIKILTVIKVGLRKFQGKYDQIYVFDIRHWSL